MGWLCHKTAEQIIGADTFFKVLTLSLKWPGSSEVLSLKFLKKKLRFTKIKTPNITICIANVKEFEIYN